MSMSSDVIYTLWTTYPKCSPIVQKVILNVFISASKFIKKRQMVKSLRQTVLQLDRYSRNLKMVC